MHLEQLIGENTRTFCSVFPNGMLRVVNVERVLENCACRGTGEITLRIEDDIITENNGTWRLHFASGEKNKVEKTDAVPDPHPQHPRLFCPHHRRPRRRRYPLDA